MYLSLSLYIYIYIYMPCLVVDPVDEVALAAGELLGVPVVRGRDLARTQTVMCRYALFAPFMLLYMPY